MSVHPIAVELDAWIDPSLAFAQWAGRHDHCFWLDGEATESGGWSWVGVGTPADPEIVTATPIGARTASPDTWPAGRFRGGWVGWLGYEMGAAAAGAPVHPDAAEAPSALWLRASQWYAFDHAQRRAFFVEHDDTGSRPDTFGPPLSAEEAHPRPSSRPASAVARHNADEYAALIERCRAHIREGDAYQLCLTTRFTVAGPPVDPLAVYLRLRAGSPAPFGALIRSGDVALLSASPERFLDVDGSRVRTSPIKGTRGRSPRPAEDAALAAELLGDEKERAENLMIVDLMRNDLSRVCEPGSIAVEELFAVHSYRQVHQLVSTVSGTLRPGIRVSDLLAATFPAGSMTGAPKLSAMTILHRLEGAPRGVFSGCLGWIGDDGGLDLAMIIRSIVAHPDGAYVGAGGGITWRSVPAAEVAEVALKARGPLAALGAALPEGW
ncbi:aminodeoxychorismate synthase component I [Microbacterium sp. ET2]|uniref:aminodeoxychorismate synthase component I n=1 Tax=Microbacterium albipurpureum TaxID=3050384 RepID=UPI00259CD8E9|nr:aminodeoxychorismate synthase component I [Microbacterium sp. ET2 (Ac-2212)]WJL95685.1 aminodeoxychorismate synthase component I [Microbacterium sp. ET2 (Ac-2212)]